MNLTCNIDKTDRTNRTVLGVLLCLAAVLGAGRWFYFILGVVMIVQGYIGWCSIPYLMQWFNKNKP